MRELNHEYGGKSAPIGYLFRNYFGWINIIRMHEIQAISRLHPVRADQYTPCYHLHDEFSIFHSPFHRRVALTSQYGFFPLTWIAVRHVWMSVIVFQWQYLILFTPTFNANTTDASFFFNFIFLSFSFSHSHLSSSDIAVQTLKQSLFFCLIKKCLCSLSLLLCVCVIFFVPENNNAKLFFGTNERTNSACFIRFFPLLEKACNDVAKLQPALLITRASVMLTGFFPSSSSFSPRWCSCSFWWTK